MYDSSCDSRPAHLKRTLYHFHFCCGLGGGARGFNRARPVVGNVEARWECLGGVDVDPAGLRDFERLAGVPGTLLDLFTRDQYIRFHGQEPPAGWREASADDVRRAAQNLRPDAVFISSPCKGASGLLSEATSKTPKYQALNELTLRCIWLMGEAWKDDPVPLIVFENVPRLATRGRHLLDQIGEPAELGKNRTLRFSELPQRPEFPVFQLAALPPNVIAGQVDVLPAQWRKVLQ